MLKPEHTGKGTSVMSTGPDGKSGTHEFSGDPEVSKYAPLGQGNLPKPDDEVFPGVPKLDEHGNRPKPKDEVFPGVKAPVDKGSHTPPVTQTPKPKSARDQAMWDGKGLDGSEFANSGRTGKQLTGDDLRYSLANGYGTGNLRYDQLYRIVDGQHEGDHEGAAKAINSGTHKIPRAVAPSGRKPAQIGHITPHPEAARQAAKATPRVIGRDAPNPNPDIQKTSSGDHHVSAKELRNGDKFHTIGPDDEVEHHTAQDVMHDPATGKTSVMSHNDTLGTSETHEFDPKGRGDRVFIDPANWRAKPSGGGSPTAPPKAPVNPLGHSANTGQAGVTPTHADQVKQGDVLTAWLPGQGTKKVTVDGVSKNASGHTITVSDEDGVQHKVQVNRADQVEVHPAGTPLSDAKAAASPVDAKAGDTVDGAKVLSRVPTGGGGFSLMLRTPTGIKTVDYDATGRIIRDWAA